MPFDMENLGWCGYQTVKIFEDMFIRFDRIHERDGHTHTHTQTLHDDIARVCIASRGKNSNKKLDCDQTAQTSAKASNLIRR